MSPYVGPKGEMTEHNLLRTAQTFWPNGNWGGQNVFSTITKIGGGFIR